MICVVAERGSEVGREGDRASERECPPQRRPLLPLLGDAALRGEVMPPGALTRASEARLQQASPSWMNDPSRRDKCEVCLRKVGSFCFVLTANVTS